MNSQELRDLSEAYMSVYQLDEISPEIVLAASKAAGKKGKPAQASRLYKKFAPTGFFTTFGAGAITAMNPAIGIPLAALATGGRYGATKLRQRGITGLSEMMRQPQQGFGVRLNQSLPTGSQYYAPTGLLAEQLQEE